MQISPFSANLSSEREIEVREGERDLTGERERSARVRVSSHPTAFPLPKLRNREIILLLKNNQV